MPNLRNVARPITLVGLGRSGTTLVTNIFNAHPKVQAIGETGNLIFSAYYHIHESLPVCGTRKPGESLEEAAARSVHAVLTRTFPSRQRHWFHKPIRVPTIARYFGKDYGRFVDYFWSASAELFPQGRFLTVLRDPGEVAISSMTRWKMDGPSCLRMLDWNYDLLLGEQSRVGLYLAFEELQEDRERAVRKLLDFSGMKFHPKCLKAFERPHAVNPPRDENAAPIEIPLETIEKYRKLRERISS